MFRLHFADLDVDFKVFFVLKMFFARLGRVKCIFVCDIRFGIHADQENDGVFGTGELRVGVRSDADGDHVTWLRRTHSILELFHQNFIVHGNHKRVITGDSEKFCETRLGRSFASESKCQALIAARRIFSGELLGHDNGVLVGD